MLLAQCVCSEGVKRRVQKMADFYKVNMFKKKKCKQKLEYDVQKQVDRCSA